MKLRAIKGEIGEPSMVRKARLSSPSFQPCKISVVFPKFKPAAPKNKIKLYTYAIKLRPVRPMQPGYSCFSSLAKIGHLTMFILKNDAKYSIIGQSTSFSTIDLSQTSLDQNQQQFTTTQQFMITYKAQHSGN